MKTLVLFVCFVALQSFADIRPPVRWDVETGRLEPRPWTLSIRRGETLTIEPRFISYDAPIALSNALVEMRYSSSYDMATHYSAPGSLLADTGRVQIAWSDSLNPTNNSMYYEIRATIGTQILARAYGPLKFLGGMVGINTGLTARTSLDWATVAQSGGIAVLSNQLGVGAVWTGSNWAFGASAVDLSFTNSLAPRSWVAGFSNAPATWNADFATIDVALPDGVTGQMFQENHVYGKNDTGAVISNGTVCYIASASGFNCAIVPANATNGYLTNLRTIGIATHNIGIGASGKVTTFGNVNEIDTTHLIEGQPIYLDTVTGKTTTNAATYPNANVHLGVCLRSHATQGRIYVSVQSIPHPQDIGAATSTHSQPLSTITNAGTAAYSNADAFATAAQGSLADASIQNGYSTTWPQYPDTIIVKASPDIYGDFNLSGIYCWTNFLVSASGETNSFGGWINKNNFEFGIWYDDYTSQFRIGVWYGGSFTYFFMGNAPTNYTMQNGESFTNLPVCAFATWTPVAQAALTAVQPSELGGYVATNGSGASLTDITAAQVGALPIGGGTVTGAVYTTLDHLTSAPADQELATAGWVRDLFPVTANYYSSSNDNTVVTNLGFTCRIMGEDIPPISSGVFTTGLTNGGYLANIATTQKVNATGTAVINAYISAVGANPTPSLTLHPEIYATADGTTLYGDWDVQNQTITLGGTTNLYTFVIPIGSITNSYVVRRWKIGTANNITSIRFHNGTNSVDTASRMGLTVSGTPVDEYVLTADKIAAAGGVTNVSINGTLFSVVGGVATGTVAAGGGNVAAESNNLFYTSTPITFTNNAASIRWIGATFTNSYYLTSTSAVWQIGTNTYAFP